MTLAPIQKEKPMTEKRKYSLDEIDLMRNDLERLLRPYGRKQYSFSSNGYAKCGVSWGFAYDPTEMSRQVEDRLRTALLAGVSPDELADQVEKRDLQDALTDAMHVVADRRLQMLPEPNDCRHVALLKAHGKYTEDTRDPEVVRANVEKLKTEERTRDEALKRLRSCGHVTEHFLSPTDQCGCCDYGLMPGIVVTQGSRSYRCANCSRLTDEPMGHMPDDVHPNDSAEVIARLLLRASRRTGWCLSCLKKRVKLKGAPQIEPTHGAVSAPAPPQSPQEPKSKTLIGALFDAFR